MQVIELYLQFMQRFITAINLGMEGQTSHPIFQSYPELKQQWVSLIPQATPVARLESFGPEVGHGNLYVKREDLTAPGYGGNKVRNLEFLLGRARSFGCSRVAMVAPLGSNFVAAAASQSARIGMRSEFFHFTPTQNTQIHQHACERRSRACNANS
jgi:1-aminocyclopropane-1-carboxylate deaminase/D-cysteine desulfhydrase-like pyridoxal-dependent ACC family enzyme